MYFFTVARIYRHPDDVVSLRDAWMIADGELSATAEIALKHLQNEKELAELHHEVAWLVQALIEFMDLVSFPHQAKGEWQHANYLYFEAIGALREATVGMLNGSPRASTGLLRSVLEMFLLHCWWHARISRTHSSVQFYDWLEGRRPKPKFMDVVRNNFENLGIPPDATAMEKVKRTYERLSSYVHAPLRKESVTTLNQGNLGYVGTAVLRHWLFLARDALQIVLEQFVHLYPQCLFPVDITRKFGFNPPVGMYFDKYNFVPLIAAFGTAQIETCRTRLQNHELVQVGKQFYESRPDLTRAQILKTWNDENQREAADDATDDMVVLWFRAKAQMRVISWVLSYAEPLRSN